MLMLIRGGIEREGKLFPVPFSPVPLHVPIPKLTALKAEALDHQRIK